MRNSSRRVLCFAVALAWSFGARAAYARDLDYRTVEGCPSRAEVERRLAEGSSGTRDVRIDVHRAEGGFRGEVVVGEGERRLERTVEARTCGGVIEALALVVALDREDETTTRAEPAHDPAPASAPPARVAPPEPAVRGASDAPERDGAALAPERGKQGSGVVGVFGSSILVTSFAQGEVLFGSSFSAEVAAKRGVAGLGWLRPTARASFIRTSSTGWSERGGVSPDFSVTGGAFDVCQISPWSEDQVIFSICSRTEIGALSASAAGDDASSQSRWWLATGAVGRARYVFATRGPVRPMIELSGGALASLIRDRFHFPGHDEIVASPWLWTASLAGGVELR